jgi:hypothetical protein
MIIISLNKHILEFLRRILWNSIFKKPVKLATFSFLSQEFITNSMSINSKINGINYTKLFERLQKRNGFQNHSFIKSKKNRGQNGIGIDSEFTKTLIF